VDKTSTNIHYDIIPYLNKYIPQYLLLLNGFIFSSSIGEWTMPAVKLRKNRADLNKTLSDISSGLAGSNEEFIERTKQKIISIVSAAGLKAATLM